MFGAKKMSSEYSDNLINKILKLSKNKNWDIAVSEWEIVACDEDEEISSICICGKENIRYLFKIKNLKNNNILYPIGSSCIKKFERQDLNEIVSIKEKLFKLLFAIENKYYITLSSEYFSRKLLKYLYQQKCFKASKYNNFNPEEDYIFLLNMFNKQNKSSITINQKNKITAIIMSTIKPYLAKQLKRKDT